MGNDLKISIVIPTMWRSNKILKMLPIYEKSELVKEVIIIDNDPKLTPNLKLYSKVLYYTNGNNIYVNPAWNLGYTLSSHRVILANDDIIIDELDNVLNLLINSDYDIVGISLEKTNEGLKIIPIDKFPANSYGCFIYIKKYHYIPEKYKIWYGDQFLFEMNEKRGLLKNSNIITNVSETLNSNKQELRKSVALNDVQIYEKEGFSLKNETNKLKVFVALVNYGDEQINFLEKVVNELKSFKKYDVTVVVNSNIPLNIPNIDKVNLFQDMNDYQLLPLTCRTTIIENINDYDVFVYGENDHLFKEIHIDKHVEYSKILPNNRISGLIQYEENNDGKFYPAYHAHYDWDYSSVEVYDNKLFAHFTNVHQATFILTKEQLINISKQHDFRNFFGKSKYSVKCKVNTDIYDFCGMKKMICISEFKDNIIHHLPNLYIHGENGRNKNQRSDNKKMNDSLIRLFKGTDKIICGIATTLERKDSLKDTVDSIINQVDELIVYQNDYNEVFDFLKNDKIKVLSSINTGVNMGDAGKFYLVGEYPNSYYLTIDDDIIYPVDYVETIINGLKKYNNKVIVSHHGRLFGDNVNNYYADYIKSYHFRLEHIGYDRVHTPGTGVMGFHTKHVPIKFSDFIYPNMADIIVGVKMSKLDIDCICLPHKENWLKDSTKYDQHHSLFNKNKNNEILNKFLRENLIVRKTDNGLTIIIPTYNNTEFLNECLDSVIKSVKNLNCEILVGIDFCQKTMDEIKNKTFDKRIKFYFFTKNVGPYVIKNSLSEISNSNNLLFFDSDDIMKENMVNDMLSEIHKCDFVKPKYINFNHSEGYEKYINETRSNLYGEGVFMIRKDLFLSMNGFEAWRTTSDTEFMNRMYKNNKKGMVTKNITFYRRIHPNSLTQSKQTGYGSVVRRDYNYLVNTKKHFGPLPKLSTEPFFIVDVNYFLNKPVIDEVKIKKDLSLKVVSDVLNKKQNTETKVDYEKINQIIKKQGNVYDVNSSVKPVRENKPIDRTKIIELKNDSLSNLNKQFSKPKQNKKVNSPNIFSGNGRRKGGISI